MKKILLTIIMLSFIFLTACGKGKSKVITINIWEQHDEPMDKVFDVFARKFEETHKNVKIVRVHYATEDLRSQFQTAVLSGEGPEIVFGPNDNIGPFSTGKLIIPLDEFLGEEFFKRFPKNILEAAKYNDKIWGVPILMGNTLSFLYNKKLVQTPPKTFDDVINLSKIYNDRKTYALVFNEAEPFWFVAFLGAFGGKVFDDKGNITLNTPEMVKALQFLHDLKFKFKAMPDQADYNVADMLFKEGKAATFINGPWSWASYRKISDLDFDIIPIPEIKGAGRPLPYSACKTISINANLDKNNKELIDAIKSLLDYLTSKEFQVEYALISSESPVIEEAINDQKIISDPSIKAVVNQVKYSTPMPIRPEMRAVWDAMGPELKNLMGNKKTPEQAAKDMQEKAEKLAKSLK